MSITKTMKKAGAVLGLVGILALNEGCATPEGNAVASTFLGAASTPSSRDSDFDKIGKFGAGLGSVYVGAAAQRQLIEAGAPRVNVNVDTNSANSGGSYVQEGQQIIEPKAMISPNVLREGESAIITTCGPYSNLVIGYISEDPRIKFKFIDNGKNSDQIAGDGIWTFRVDVPKNAPKGNYSFIINGYNNNQITYTSGVNFKIID